MNLFSTSKENAEGLTPEYTIPSDLFSSPHPPKKTSIPSPRPSKKLFDYHYQDLTLDTIRVDFHDFFSNDIGLNHHLAKQACNIKELSELSYLIKLDRVIRCTKRHLNSFYWQDKKIENVLPPNATEDETRVIVALASLAPSGFFREKAVMFMAQHPHPYYIPYLTLRMNDWVKQISEIAAKEFIRQLHELKIKDLINALPYIDHITNYSRNRFSTIREEVLEIINEKATPEEFAFALHQASDKIRCSLIRNLLVSKHLDIELATKIVKEDKSPAIRYLVYKHLSTQGWPYTFDETIKLLKHEKYYRAKAEILKVIENKKGTDIIEVITPFIADANVIIRCHARDILRNNGIDSFRSIYINNCNENYRLRNSLIGLAECGDTNDIPFIKKYLSHEDPYVVASTLRSLSYLNVEINYADLKQFLFSDTKFLSKTARIVLKDHCTKDNYNELADKLQDDYPSFVYDNILTLIEEASKWQKIYLYYSLLESENAYIVSSSKSKIENWFKYYNDSYFYYPTSEQYQSLLHLPENTKEYHSLSKLLESVKERVK